MISLPSNAEGIDSTWILVGFLNPRLAHDSHNCGIIPREANVRVVVGSPSELGSGEGERDTLDVGEGDRDGPADDDASDDMVLDLRGRCDDLVSQVVYMKDKNFQKV